MTTTDRCVRCSGEGWYYAPDGNVPMEQFYCKCPAGQALKASKNPVVMSPYDELLAAEEKFLLECGWTKEGPDAWKEPPQAYAIPGARDGSQRILNQGHAMNSETLYGRARGTSPRPRRKDLIAAQLLYLARTGWADADSEIHGAHAFIEPEGRHRKRRIYQGLHRATNSQKNWDQFERRHSAKENT